VTTTIDLAALPSLPLDERRDLPDETAIYFVLAGDIVLYIGQSVSLRQRWDAHHRLKQLNEYGGCRIAWMQVDNTGLLDDIERACIAHFNPVLNREPLPGGARSVRAGEAWVSARIPEAASARIAALAAREERSVSFIVRRLILEALESDRYQ